ncbi:hypothetical protein OU415_02425 [Saccharopolyspora sp. WRP15-2]|uniref:Uncharacterized protein n=1 Tax=Saccharopolyspora oryzae TaxID=2997343 RepID=A0ABT4URW3_9PSEU|nr:hypothetical protein [Saccharopolyspora oryzae]MDA3624273.1 hypothetical protein [Saccharopolyspora oryzae]
MEPDNVTDCQASRCGRPSSNGAALCESCTMQLEADLRMAHSLAGDLNVALTRQHRFGSSIGVVVRGGERPLPVNLRASDAAAELQRELSTWCHDLAGLRALRVDAPETVSGLASWLLRHLSEVQAHPAAGLVADGIGRVVAAAVRVVDRPVDRWYAGRCGCGEDLYARARTGQVQCSACRAVYDIGTRREQLLAAIEDQLATTTELCRALTLLGRPLKAEQVRKWAERGKLVQKAPHPADPKHLPRYRVGDVVQLLQMRDAA